MPLPFSETLRALDCDGGGRSRRRALALVPAAGPLRWGPRVARAGEGPGAGGGEAREWGGEGGEGERGEGRRAGAGVRAGAEASRSGGEAERQRLAAAGAVAAMDAARRQGRAAQADRQGAARRLDGEL